MHDSTPRHSFMFDSKGQLLHASKVAFNAFKENSGEAPRIFNIAATHCTRITACIKHEHCCACVVSAVHQLSSTRSILNMYKHEAVLLLVLQGSVTTVSKASRSWSSVSALCMMELYKAHTMSKQCIFVKDDWTLRHKLASWSCCIM